MRRFTLIFALIGTLLLAACGGGRTDISEIPFDDIPEDAQIERTNSGLEYIVLEAGEGRSPAPGDIVEVEYIGRLLADGSEFDNSFERDEPFSFTVGAGQVIAGWDEAMLLLNEGAEAILIVPPELGYGANPSPGSGIPPNSTLVFRIELVDVSFP